MNHVCTRDAYDRFQEEQIRAVLGDRYTPEAMDELVDKLYPKTTAAAVQELRFRGFDAQPESAATGMFEAPLIVIGGVRVWYRADIDRFADYLRASNQFTPPAQWRLENGITWRQDRETVALLMERADADYLASRETT